MLASEVPSGKKGVPAPHLDTQFGTPMSGRRVSIIFACETQWRLDASEIVSRVPGVLLEKLCKDMLADRLICSGLQCGGDSLMNGRDVWGETELTYFRVRAKATVVGSTLSGDRSVGRHFCSFVEPLLASKGKDPI